MSIHKNRLWKTFLASEQLRATALLWIMVAGVCAVLANVIAKAYGFSI